MAPEFRSGAWPFFCQRSFQVVVVTIQLTSGRPRSWQKPMSNQYQMRQKTPVDKHPSTIQHRCVFVFSFKMFCHGYCWHWSCLIIYNYNLYFQQSFISWTQVAYIWWSARLRWITGRMWWSRMFPSARPCANWNPGGGGLGGFGWRRWTGRSTDPKESLLVPLMRSSVAWCTAKYGKCC